MQQSPIPNMRPVVRHPGLGIGVLFGSFFFMLLLVSLAVMFLGYGDGSSMSAKALRIFTVAQDVLVFILPALLAAFLSTRLPAQLLGLTTKPRLVPTLLAIVVLLTAMPAMDLVITLNDNIHFPESMQGFEEMLRGLEDTASDAVGALAFGTTVPQLIVSILIIGLLTGLSEELFFRGAMQNLFMSTRMKRHLCIWLVAVIFSFMHFQFFGFIPRVLLGAYFGYLIWWTGSVWVPVIAHAFNNSCVVVAGWIAARGGAEAVDESVATGIISTDVVTVILSVAVTALGIIVLRRNCLRRPR